MKQSKKELGVSRCQKGGNNGEPLNPRPKELRPKPPAKRRKMKAANQYRIVEQYNHRLPTAAPKTNIKEKK